MNSISYWYEYIPYWLYPIPYWLLKPISREPDSALLPSNLILAATEDRLDIYDVLADIESGKITEVFGCGTAAVISPVGKLSFKGREYVINRDRPGPVAKHLYDELTGIEYGRRKDPFGWVWPVN